MEPKAALSAIRDFIAPVAPLNAPDPSEGANGVSGQASRAATPQPVGKAAPAEPSQPVDDGPQPGDLRLVIEQNDDTGDYIYKTVDRRTGETLQQFPREQVLKLREETGYASGVVFDGEA
jgi:flagellar protein FlaG